MIPACWTAPGIRKYMVCWKKTTGSLIAPPDMIWLYLALFRVQHEVLAQTGPGSEQLWHNLPRLFTVQALHEKEIIMTSEEVTRSNQDDV